MALVIQQNVDQDQGVRGKSKNVLFQSSQSAYQLTYQRLSG